MPSSRRGNNAGPPNPKKKKRTQQVAAPAAALVQPLPAHLPTDAEVPTDAHVPPPPSIPLEDSTTPTLVQTKKMSISESPSVAPPIETNGCKEEDTPKAPASEVVPNHTDSPQGGGSGRERIVVAIKANSSIVVDAKSLRHSGSKRHKKSSSGDSSSFSSSSKKSSKERKSKRNSPSISFSSNPPTSISEPVLENHPIKISIANSTPSITISTTNSTPSSTGNKKVEKLKMSVSDKWEKQEKSKEPSTPSNSTLPLHQSSTPSSSKSTRSTSSSSSSPNTSSSSSVNMTPSSLTPLAATKKEATSTPDTPVISTKKKGQARIKVTPTASERNSSGRASKRPRLQYQPYQAPSTDTPQYAFFKSPHSKSAEDKIMVFGKGEFLAVRNENGGFYVCRTAQNVYKSSRRFKIQWLNSGKEPNTYTPDFYDTTDFECVLTNLRMKRVDKNVYLLPEEETKRTMNILQRALNVESGMDKPDPHQVALDGVDVSIVGKEEEEEIIKKQRDLEMKKQQELAAAKMKTKFKKEKLEEEPPAKKIKISSEPAIKSEEKKPLKATSVPTPTKRKHAEKLKPNLEISVVEKDPTFESTIQVPFVSTTAHSRLLIRAILLKDLQLLQSLISDTKNICSLHYPRSLHIKKTALSYAIKMQNHQAIKLLLSAPPKKYASPPDILISEDHSGSYNPMMLGHGIRPITTARGGKEGNTALIKDNDSISTYPFVNEEVISEALREGVSLSTLRLLCEKSGCCMSEVYSHIVEAIRFGHHKLAGQLVSEALEKGGFGFNHLHKEALLNAKQEFSPFKTVSVTKKATDNARITPLHCAAINPNSRHLAALLSHAPEYQLADRDGWQPMHYAAACTSTAPLELLLSRGASTEEVNSQGNTPLHVACLVGRHRNVGTLLSHAAIICDQSKTEENSFLLSQYEKYGVGGIDRPNNKSYTPLHLAVQNGHLDVVKVLLNNSVDIEKPTSANQEKMTPLMIAAQQGHFKIAKLLVNHGAMVEARDKKQRTPLTYAVMNGNTHVASYLLHLGADPNTLDSSGNSLIHYACAYGWHFCLQLLIEAGASPNTPNDWKLVPLAAAFMKGHIGLVNYLVEQPGVDVNLGMNHDTGMTLLMQTLKIDKIPYQSGVPETPINASMLERVKFLIEKLHVDAAKLDFSNNNALHYLVETETTYLNYLSSRGHILDEKEDESLAPYRGIVEASQEIADFLLEEMKKEHNSNLEKVVQILLKNGCKPSIKNNDGESPFSLALKNGCLALVKIFLENGCGLTFTANASTGNTILHYMVEQVADVEAELLWKAILEADCPLPAPEDSITVLHKMVTCYNKDGFTPLLYALHHYTSKQLKPHAKDILLKYIKFLMDDLSADCTFPLKNDKNQVVGSALHIAIKDPSGTLVKLLLTKRPPLDPLDLDSRTPLIAAIINGMVEAAEQLIQAGANLGVKSPKDDGLPPLLLACRKEGMTKVIQLLIQNKAPLHVANPKNGNTALHYLVSQPKKDADTVKLVKSLLLSIDVNTPNHRHQTPLHLCVQHSTGGTDAYYGVEELLLTSKAKTEALDHASRTPLHYAFTSLQDKGCTSTNEEISSNDPIELVTLLLNFMTNQSVSIQDVNGQTPLHLAASCGATISTIHLMQKSNNVELKDKDGNTALGLAIINGHQSTVLVMLQKNASCVAELVKIAAKDTTFLPHAWYWEHLLKPPRPPTKITILQETVRRDWQSILYIMLDQLEAVGKGFTVAIEAALTMASYNLALKLISRVKHNWTLYSERQSTLHMLARHAPADRLLDQQLKVANALIEKGVPVMARDEHGCSVLTYAAVNWNHTLFNFFADKVGITSAAQADPDKSLRTPLTAFFWRLESTDFPPPVRSCCESLLTNAANVDLLTQFPFRESPYPGIRCVANMEEIHQESASAPRLSPLLVAVYRQNYPVVKFLLQNGADVNFADDLHRTPLMHAARLHDLKMVKLLLNYDYEPEKDTTTEYRPGTVVLPSPAFKQTSPADLTRRDVHGYTVLHHAICPSVDFGYHHTALVNFLVHAGVPTDVPNNDGDTPLQMAQNAHALAMINVLYDWLNVAPELRDIPSKPSPTLVTAPPLEAPTWNWKEDFRNYLEKLDSESEAKPLPPLPDKCSKVQDSGEVVFDKEKDLPYDVVLTNVDLRYRHAGLYNFYKMQVLRQKERNLAILFTRWGRVGDVGQYQRTPFQNIDAAIAEFCKIFKSKTGNAWENVKSFKALPKKYRLVAQEKRVHTQKKILLPQKLVSEVPSQLPQPISDLFNKLVDVHIKENSWDHLSIQPEAVKMTFGRISEEILQKAENILNQINAILSKHSEQERDLIDPDPFTYNQIIELSEEFYHLVPVFGYEFEKLEPLFKQHNVDSMMRLLDNIRHISLAAEVILGAHHKSSTVSPMDYIYRSVGCQMELLPQQSTDAQMILQYLYNTSLASIKAKKYSAHGGDKRNCFTPPPHVTAIYRLQRPPLDREESFSGDSMMLWHGTPASNLLGILHRGLQVAPLGSSLSGAAFGKGIYFSDMYEKSEHYSGNSETKYVLLCEVSLGAVKYLNCPRDSSPKDEKYDTLKVIGNWVPDPLFTVSYQGVLWPMGSSISSEASNTSFWLDYSEYVVKSPGQVQLRYLVQIGGPSPSSSVQSSAFR